MFRSARHKNRPVVFVGGGRFQENHKSEILDYTLVGSTWQECNYLNKFLAITTIRFSYIQIFFYISVQGSGYIRPSY